MLLLNALVQIADLGTGDDAAEIVTDFIVTDVHLHTNELDKCRCALEDGEGLYVCVCVFYTAVKALFFFFAKFRCVAGTANRLLLTLTLR